MQLEFPAYSPEDHNLLDRIIGWPRKATEELLEICQFQGKKFRRKKKRDLLAGSKA
jgi:hypothetical protein